MLFLANHEESMKLLSTYKLISYNIEHWARSHLMYALPYSLYKSKFSLAKVYTSKKVLVYTIGPSPHDDRVKSAKAIYIRIYVCWALRRKLFPLSVSSIREYRLRFATGIMKPTTSRTRECAPI